MVVQNSCKRSLKKQDYCDILRKVQNIWNCGDEMKVYERVRDYIDDHGLKQLAVAEKSGIPKTTFSAIMNGKRTLYADDLRAICLALNVSPELFIDLGCDYQK